MFRKTIAGIACALLGSLAFAGPSAVGSAAALPASLVESQIADTEWSLKHSSVAGTIDKIVQDASLNLLARARSEMAAGNIRTAQELARRAARPLVEMAATAQAGKHPDQGEHLRDLIAATASIIDGAAKIASEKQSPAVFLSLSRESLREAQELAASGQPDAAKSLLLHVYSEVQSEVARLRAGDRLVIDLPAEGGERAWSDGVRRLDERRQLTDYLILEAESVGIDPSPLRAGIAAAELSANAAREMAREKRWDLALLALETAYLRHEDSWRAVGVEW